ncbi:MAG: hypothetical protein FWE78_01105, partial [Methanimicrococcus sp.]|nr:hypothetical protein [Methanimicrococcus sp.]
AGYKVTTSDAPAPAGYDLNATPYDPALPKIASFIVDEDNGLLMVYLDENLSDTVTINIKYYLAGATPTHLGTYDTALVIWAGYRVTSSDAPAPAGYVLNATPYDPALPKIASFIRDDNNSVLDVYLNEESKSTGTGTGNATIRNPSEGTSGGSQPGSNPQEQQPGREREPPKIIEYSFAGIILLFLAAVSIYLFVWKHREEEEE